METIPTLLGAAWLLPLVSFTLILLFGPRMGKAGKAASYVAIGAIGGGFVLSLIALFQWRGIDEPYLAGEWYTLAQFDSLKLTIGYYVDTLTVVMFCMVTLIATCIHFYAVGYMHEELHDVTDHEVTLADGSHLTRPGRFHRFFQYLSLFCFSMLGIVISGNIAMTFVFWELVGICSYFLIGFYIERKSASTAANKAFIVNRVGDMGMIIGLMVLFTTLGTFNFGDVDGEPGIFSLVRPEVAHHDDHAGRDAAASPFATVALAPKADAGDQSDHHGDHTAHATRPLVVPQGMFDAAVRDRVAAGEEATAENLEAWQSSKLGYGLLVIAGLGIFCGCVGKSAQFPLHVWLPDAMEGPTPVSALVHSATMVAAGVFLVGRFYPVFTPEVLLAIAVIGCFTLFMAATIAITATDIKRVLAYSTLSQLGYMMFALGVGGWVAGMLHLITHAFFKSLLFMCSGSVIHAVHSNEMTDMGGLLKKMPITAYTMLVGCLAIIGAGIPLVIGLSGYYSKDAILAQAMLFAEQDENGLFRLMFFVAAGGAAITAFYMFRLWFMTFLGEPRDAHRYEHAHESPKVMTYPLLVLSFFAIFVATPLTSLDMTTAPLTAALDEARPADDHQARTAEDAAGATWLSIPYEHDSHTARIHTQAGLIAFGTAMGGLLLACCIYWWRLVNPREVADMFRPIYRFLLGKWWFDELYDRLFVQPTFFFSRIIAGIDKNLIDWLIDNLAAGTRWFCVGFDTWIDRLFVDGLVNWTARKIYAIGLAFRAVQTGNLRQYIVLIVVGTVALFILATFGFAG
ncbi:MAG: NADH-quinone oxidoreductase subunit L [Planctomycetota bacterium]|nr:MAG: NADH-quinone oxidoreductase subunit L [Planctomycetota bacterium]REJ94834.1 MAG: NADH-quinone oxidoreductase subunit L [Planctomycetota bacterium]REK25503.1 MAG: NADH-quinone oxidoreductase subunit L [Planctomycetota bacterium]REK45937.1 MAG: NADH-quinone oxidoreductase subunit L [Planctomycetota bacterium]